MLLVHPSRNITLRGKRRSLAVNVGKYIMHWVFGIVQHTYIQETTAASGEAWDAWNNGTDFTFLFHDQVPGLLKQFRLIYPKLDDQTYILILHVTCRCTESTGRYFLYQATFPLKIAGRFHPTKISYTFLKERISEGRICGWFSSAVPSIDFDPKVTVMNLNIGPAANQVS